MKIKEKAEALAEKEKIKLKLFKSPSYGLNAVWYKSNNNEKDVWLYYASSWTDAHKRLNEYRKWKVKRRKILKERKLQKALQSS
jgi:hypothetical protein